MNLLPLVKSKSPTTRHISNSWLILGFACLFLPIEFSVLAPGTTAINTARIVALYAILVTEHVNLIVLYVYYIW